MKTRRDYSPRRNPGRAIGKRDLDVEDQAERATRVVIRPDVPASTEFLPHRANALKLTTLKKVADRYGIKITKMRYWQQNTSGFPEVKGRLVDGSGRCPYLYDAQELVLFVEKRLNTEFMRKMSNNPHN